MGLEVPLSNFKGNLLICLLYRHTDATVIHLSRLPPIGPYSYRLFLQEVIYSLENGICILLTDI